MDVNALLFDLDGTLADTERESAEAMARAFSKGQGVQISDDDRQYIIGRSWVDIYNEMRRRHPSLTWSREEMIHEVTIERETVFEEANLKPLPGVERVFETFANMPKALVTGSSRAEARQTLEALSLTSAFLSVHAAEDVPTSKPEPDGYLAAAKALNVAIETTVVIEDSEAGISAGVRAGAKVVAVSVGNFSNQNQSHAHLIIETLEEFTPALLRGL